MAKSWYSIIEGDIASVDDKMRAEVRSAYPELNDMCESTMRSRYHAVRPALCILSYYVNGGEDSELAVNTASCFESVFEGLHLHDLIDSSGNVLGDKKKLFDKIPSTTKVIVAGDFMYLMGFRLAYAKAPKIVPYLMEASASISDSIFHIVDISHGPSVSEQDCIKVMMRKSAIEYQLLMGCAAEQAGADEQCIKRMRECGSYIGMALQLESDMEDIFDDKPEMISVQSGYPTMPIFYSMQHPEYGAEIKRLFSIKNPEPTDVEEIVSLIKRTDAKDRCKALKADYLSKASEIIGELSDSVYVRSLSEFVKESYL